MRREPRTTDLALGSVVPLVPRPIPVRCPICDGRATVERGFYRDEPSAGSPYVKCRSCYGTGIVR